MSSSSEHRGSLDLQFEAIRGVTYVARRRYTWPFSIGREFHLPAHPDMSTVIVQSSSGTINAGDALGASFEVLEGARAQIRSQGAVSVHRADGDRVASENVRLIAADEGVLEYIPEPRVLFPRSRFRQRMEIEVAQRGVVVAIDSFIAIVGDSGDGFDDYSSDIAIRCEGEERAHERTRLRTWSRLPSFARRLAAGAQIVVADPGGILASGELPDERYEDSYLATSALPNGAGVAVRIAAVDGRALRSAIEHGMRQLRAALTDDARRPITEGRSHALIG